MTIDLNISWAERFALIKKYQPSETEVTSTFGVTTEEYKRARQLLREGLYNIGRFEDVERYGNIFSDPTIKRDPNAPRAAIKPIATPKKRGRKGDKILKAFEAVPATPTPLDDFSREYEVSIPVLRQAKRFDTTDVGGRVRVKQINQNGQKQLMIWREEA